LGSASRPRRGIKARFVATALVTVILAGCAVGPNYKRPPIVPPEETRGQIGPAEAASLADLPWWHVFEDHVLQQLVTDAIRDNYDLQTAIFRVEQSRELIGVKRADLFPQIDYRGAASRQKAFQITGLPNETFNLFLGSFNLAWEIDIWGRIRRATESARADYLGAEAFRRGVLLTLVSDVAQAYFELLELDRELEIARLTTQTFENTLDLFTRQYEGGVGTRLEVSRGAAAVEEAAVTIPDIERSIVAPGPGERQLLMLARVALARPEFAFLYRVDELLGAADMARVLRALTARAITYVTFSDSDTLAAEHDVVLRLEAGGAWHLSADSRRAPA
jgi:multidrug efflux system outer membrane protein